MKFKFRFCFFIVLFLSTILSSCSIEDPDFSEFGNFKLIQLDGQKVKVSFDIKIENENAFGFKIKRGKLDLKVNNQLIGLINLTDKIKVKRKSQTIYSVPLTIDLSDGALFQLIKLSKSNAVDVEIEGKVRGSVCGIGKTFRVKEKKSINGSQLKMP